MKKKKLLTKLPFNIKCLKKISTYNFIKQGGISYD